MFILLFYMWNTNRTTPTKAICATLFIFCFVGLIAACRNTSSKKPVPGSPVKSATATPPKPRFIKIDTALLASRKDLVCYMPLWTGIGDTCTYKGKIYGFCSKDCKDDFLKSPTEYIPK
jgi:YHS domain-containing protein